MLPQNLLIIDTETTGLEPETHFVIELGAILYSVKHRCILQQMSTLLPIDGENPAEQINRIKADASREAYHHNFALKLFQKWHDHADYLIAHNTEFDQKWFGQNGLPPVTKPWLCTCNDFKWSQASKQQSSLVNLALEYGIGVNSAHRALTDCQLIAALFERVDNFEELLLQAIQRSQEPQYYFIANVSFDDKDLAKERGFRWNQYIKQKWVKKMRRSDYEIETMIMPFPFKVTYTHIA